MENEKVDVTTFLGDRKKLSGLMRNAHFREILRRKTAS